MIFDIFEDFQKLQFLEKVSETEALDKHQES